MSALQPQSSWPRGLSGKNYNVLNEIVAHDHSNVNICERAELLINVLRFRLGFRVHAAEMESFLITCQVSIKITACRIPSSDSASNQGSSAKVHVW